MSIYSAKKWWEKLHTNKLLWCLIFLYTIIFIGVSILKYTHSSYDGLDLAIYNQVFYNTVRGSLFHFTIHPHSYLGDHIELVILLLAPFYALYKNPISLLILQTIWIAATAYPLYRIAEQKISNHYALLLSASYLANAFVHNINLFEFHILSLAMPLIVWMFYVYQKKQFSLFFILIILLLATREDVAFMVFFFGCIPLLEKRKWYWYIIPMVSSALWLPIALKLTTIFSGYSQYKFAIYYGWIGENWQEIIQHIGSKPTLFLEKAGDPSNFFLSIAIIASFGTLPLWRLKYLVPTIPIFGQFIFSYTSGEIVLKSHYLSLVIPWLFIGSIFAVQEIIEYKKEKKYWPIKKKMLRIVRSEPSITVAIIILIILYNFFTMSPLPSVAKMLFIPNDADKLKVEKTLLNKIPQQDSVISTYDTLTNLSSREEVYSLHYIFTGKKQLSDENYSIESKIDWFYYDSVTYSEYESHFGKIEEENELFYNGDNRMRKFIQDKNLNPFQIIDDIILYKNGSETDIEPYHIYTDEIIPKYSINKNIDENITLLGWGTINSLPQFPVNKGYSFYWKCNNPTEQPYYINIIINDTENKTVYQKQYAMAYGIFPSTDWEKNMTVQTNYRFLIPEKYNNKNYNFNIQLEKITSGDFRIDGIRSTSVTNKKIEPIDAPIYIEKL